jgi:hypothetical protein
VNQPYANLASPKSAAIKILKKNHFLTLQENARGEESLAPAVFVDTQ